MEGDTEQSSVAERRAFAVAKLKRAASLPRMKDGRRPRMHADGVSDGERTQSEDKKDDEITFVFDRKGEASSEATEATDVFVDATTRTITPEPAGRKRRSRSRSRSRGSRDFRLKAKGTQSPTPRPGQSPAPSPLIRGGESSADESPPPPSTSIPSSPPLVSPIPSHIAKWHASQLLMSTSPNLPESPMFYPGTSPPTPILPSLDALRGLFRSNSASARMVALQKLTGGADSYDTSCRSPSPTPPSSGVGRNNTVSGGERSVVRQNMLKRLAGRKKDGDIASGDDTAPPLSLPSPLANTSSVLDIPTSPLVKTPDHTPELTITPSPPVGPRQRTPDRNTNSPMTTLSRENNAVYEVPRRRRSVIVETEDPPTILPGLPTTLSRPPPLLVSRTAYLSDVPSERSESERDSGIGVPVYMSATQQTPSKQDQFPSTPVPTPLKDKPFREEPEEEILFAAESRGQFRDAYDREISWVADPVPESRMPIEEDDERPPSTRSSRSFTPQYEDHSPVSSSSQELMIESEVSPVVVSSCVPPSPSSVTALSNNPSVTRASDDSGSSPQMYPTRLSVASRMQSERSPLNLDFGETEEGRPVVIESTLKRPVESGSTSTWEKVKGAFTGGRRSRTNSIITRDRRDHTESSVSRESGASLLSPKPDKDMSVVAQQILTPVMQTPSASASILSLSPHNPPRGGHSPIPPASDMLKYQNAKLFPFPGIKKLEEQRNRAKVMSPSASSPEISMSPNGDSVDHSTNYSGSSSNSPSTTMTPEQNRDRKLSHQASDTRLLAKYSNLNSPPLSAAPSSSSHLEYLNVNPQPTPPSGSTTLKLPMNREGVKMWLKAKTLFSSQGSSPSTIAASSSQVDIRGPKTDKKPSFSDLLNPRTDWEEFGSEKSRTTSTTASTFRVKQATTTDANKDVSREIPLDEVSAPYPDNADNERTPTAKEVNGYSQSSYSDFDGLVSKPSASDHPSSATPDPLSSIEDYPAPSTTSESSSATSSQYSHYPFRNPSQGAIVLERLDEMLGTGSRSPMWASATEDPPRKVLLSSPVLQVVNSNTVKDRFLFLFSDILVIAKPIIHDHNQLLQTSKPSPLDRKYIVKSVVLLRHLRFSADREEPRAKMSNYASSPRHPLIRKFVHHFSKDPDHAITTLFEKSGTRDDSVVLGQLLFRTLDVDRVRLGDYLSRRTSKLVLKAYIDAFGFTGMRVDRSLRVFLLSVHVPGRTTHTHGPLEYLLDAFAARWYEANAGSVAYDKDLAVRLVRALVQLNDVMHGGIAHEPGPTGYPRRNVTSREFLEAFRRFDVRALVSDELLDNVYHSIRRERLSQARNHASSNSPDVNVTIKRVLPPRLTYRVQSEPVVLRIPQPDAYLTIQLYGQDLVFDPPSLNFAKSSEASFRVTGTSLGSKSMIMCRSGSNALKYGGLPLSSPVLIERAFMRNTFQVAFVNHNGDKRRYMFSIDDSLIRHQWTVFLKRQIEEVTSTTTSSLSSSATRGSTFHRAAEITSFKVLQEVLLGRNPRSAFSIDHTHHEVRSPIHSSMSSISKRPLSPSYNGQVHGPQQGKAAHNRSKSRSQVYHRHGPGKLELELNLSDDESQDSRDLDDEDDIRSIDGRGVSPMGVRLWSGRDLEMQCQQNSSIALVLAFLQVGSPDHGSGLS